MQKSREDIKREQKHWTDAITIKHHAKPSTLYLQR